MARSVLSTGTKSTVLSSSSSLSYPSVWTLCSPSERSTDACFAYFSVLVLGMCFHGCYCKLAPQPWWNAISSDHVGMRAIEPMRARPPLLSPGSRSHGCPSPPLPLQLEVRPHKASFLHTRYGETARPLVWLVSVWYMFPFSHSVFGVMGEFYPTDM